MTWAEACDDPALCDLYYKIEIDEHGRLVMVPRSIAQGRLKGRLIQAMSDAGMGDGLCISCPIQTTAGVLVADVAWISQERFLDDDDEDICTVAPEVCIDLGSLIPDLAFRDERLRRYFEAGTKEVWICADDGGIDFFDYTSRQIRFSRLFPGFPPDVLKA